MSDKATNYAILGGAAIMILGGVYLASRKPPGFDAGEVIIATFKVSYQGPTAQYVIQNSFGKMIFGTDAFDHIAGMTWEMNVSWPGPGIFTETLECLLPLGVAPGPYDAETLVRSPGMGQFDYHIKKLYSKAVEIR